jgi:hypothetical protein
MIPIRMRASWRASSLKRSNIRGVRWVFAGTALAFAVTCAAACDVDGLIELPRDPVDGGGGTVLPDGGGPDADGSAEDAPDDVSDAGVSPVWIGVTANPRGDTPGGPTASDKVEAKLTTIAAGARGAVVSRAWRDLDADGALEDLSGEASLYAQHGVPVLFNLAVVDRVADGRPAALTTLPWSDQQIITQLELTIDALLGVLGPSLRYLTFGRDLDRYLVENPAQRPALVGLAEYACIYARAHPDAADDLEVGVAFSFQGATAPDPSFAALLRVSDIAAISYLPGLEPEEPQVGIAASLDAVIAGVRGKPIVLQAIGAPSAGKATSSEASQQQFYDEFFAALAPRRAAIAWVNAFELHDLGSDACAAYAADQGEDPTGEFAVASCSVGLFTVSATPKAAWAEVLNGMATFASP